MEKLKRIYVILAIGFPMLVVVLPGIAFGMVRRTEEWLPMGIAALFAALPFLIVLVFIRRRAAVLDDPVKLAGVRFAARVVLGLNVGLWITPVVLLFVLRQSR